MPDAFLPEPTSQPHGSCENGAFTSRRARVELSPPQRNRSFRRWARQKFLPRPNLESSTGFSDDSGYVSGSSSSLGSELVLFEHPTYGKPGLRICDTDDYITVQNPNPHTGEMSPSVLSLVPERTEPPVCTPDSADALNIALNGQQSQQKECSVRWRVFRKEIPPTPPEHRQLPVRPPKIPLDSEEPPDALDSSSQPLQSQPSSDHYAAFDPDHLRMPGALTITPPLRTVTNGGTDAISTWVTEESRRVYELPAGPLTPGDGPSTRGKGLQGFVGAGSQMKSRSQSELPTPARTRSNTSSEPRHAVYARSGVLGPRHHGERMANAAVPRRVCSVPRKPVAAGYMAMPAPTLHGPADILKPMPAISPIALDHPPPPPPPHRYESGRPYHHGEWDSSSRRPLNTPTPSAEAPPTATFTSETHSRATQTRASVAGAFKRHPIQPSFETPSVRAQTRLNGTGVQRLVITTGNPLLPASDKVPTATTGTQTTAPSDTAERAQQTPAEKVIKPTPTDATSSGTKQPKATTTTTTKSIRKKLTKLRSAPKSSATKPTALEETVPKNTPATPAPKPSSAPAVKAKQASKTAADANAPFAAQRAAALAALREQHSRHCSSMHSHQAVEQAAAQQTEDQPSLIAVQVSTQTVVKLLQALALIWGAVAGWYMVGIVGKGLVVVLWPIRLLFKVIAVLGGCVRGGGWS